ncbi:MAG: sugar ABC transporter ATP-binding protein [Verrucomicrobia bacterium]|nr:sugar ABC transporter ATP-binding protein [Verrucomicrobiota bacterium]
MATGDPGGMQLQARNLSKSFDGVRVVDGVSIGIRAGRVHALMGENGAGKSTLVKMLAGLLAPDGGEIWWGDRRARFRGPYDARRLGIAMVPQELLPFPEMSVAENILMGREPAWGGSIWIDRAAMRRQAQRWLDRLGLTVTPERPMKELTVAEMQGVEIAKALAGDARLLILDEPTSALSDREVGALFSTVNDLRAAGVGILYITHRMAEVSRLADEITVLRDGRRVATLPAAGLEQEKLIALMVGERTAWMKEPPHASSPGLQPPSPPRPAGERAAGISGSGREPWLGESPPALACAAPGGEDGRGPAQGDLLLEVRGLGRAGHFRAITFDLRRGEIVGVAGLLGAGRTALAHALYGLAPADTGQIVVRGRRAHIRRPGDALRHGIALVSEDRQRYGMVPSMSVAHNLTLTALSRCCRGPWIVRQEEARQADHQIRTYGIKAAHRRQNIRALSGGNQQKILIARALMADPEIMILDEPTRGIDIAAKAEVHAMIRRLASEGRGVLLVSSEMPELLALSDWLLVMRGGEVVARLDPRRASPDQILRHAMPA